MDRKPLFNADAAEEYFTDLCCYYRDEKNRIFKADNEGRHPSEMVYSAEAQKLLGKELAMREVLAYFSKFRLEAWIRTKDRLPDGTEGDWMLGVVTGDYGYHGNMKFRNAICMVGYDSEAGWWLEQEPGLQGVNVTHWMPLPELPEVEA